MTAADHSCPWQTEAEALKAALAEATAKLDAVKEQLHRNERELLELKKRVTGKTSERSASPAPPKQPARPKNDTQAQSKRKKHRERRTTLPTERVEHKLDAHENSSCPRCPGTRLESMPAEESTEYEYVPGRLVRRIHARETLRCPICHYFMRATPPARVVDGGQYGPGFVTRTVVHKCADCVPLYRQVTAYGREGLHIARSTLVDLYHRAASLIEPIYKRMLELVPSNRVVYADETSLKMQRVQKLGYVWTFATELIVAYVFSPDRSGGTPVRVLGDSTGVLVVDGYTGYNHVTVPGRRIRAGCNSHARRKFVDIDDAGARHVIELYKEVFAVERDAAEQGLTGTPAHLELRQARSRPAMHAIKSWCDAHVDQYTPKSPIGEALRYLRNQWAALTVFLEDAGIAPHNNLSERLLRTVALGRKNYLFVGHEEAGHNTAMLSSLLTTCQLHDVNPQQYLADVLIRVQDHPVSQLDDLLPHRWKATFLQVAQPP